MKTIYYILLLWLPVTLLCATGCEKSDSLYGEPENIPDKLQLFVSVGEEDVIEFKADGSNVNQIAPVIFSWTPAEARGAAIEYIFKMDIATGDYTTTAINNPLGENRYERIIYPDQLYNHLANVWKVPVNETALINVAVIASVYGPVFLKPETAIIQIAAKLTE
jgi:hypothetical protein